MSAHPAVTSSNTSNHWQALSCRMVKTTAYDFLALPLLTCLFKGCTPDELHLCILRGTTGWDEVCEVCMLMTTLLQWQLDPHPQVLYRSHQKVLSQHSRFYLLLAGDWL